MKLSTGTVGIVGRIVYVVLRDEHDEKIAQVYGRTEAAAMDRALAICEAVNGDAMRCAVKVCEDIADYHAGHSAIKRRVATECADALRRRLK